LERMRQTIEEAEEPEPLLPNRCTTRFARRTTSAWRTRSTWRGGWWT
jgi:hypothetical protein